MTDMENLKLLQLKAIAKKHNIKGLSRMTKTKVIEALKDIEVDILDEPLPEFNDYK